MALYTCPDCRNQVSDQALACIHCGRPTRLGSAPAPFPTPPASQPYAQAPQPYTQAPHTLYAKLCPSCGSRNRPHVDACAHCGRSLISVQAQYVGGVAPGRHREDERADTARALASGGLVSGVVGLLVLSFILGAVALGLGIAAVSRDDKLGIAGIILGAIDVLWALLVAANG